MILQERCLEFLFTFRDEIEQKELPFLRKRMSEYKVVINHSSSRRAYGDNKMFFIVSVVYTPS